MDTTSPSGPNERNEAEDAMGNPGSGDVPKSEPEANNEGIGGSNEY